MKGIDRFGMLSRPPVRPGWSYVDLSEISHPVVPTNVTGGIHEYRGSTGHLKRGTFSCETTVFDKIMAMVDFLSMEGLHIVALCGIMDSTPLHANRTYALVHHWYRRGSLEADHPIQRPRPFAEWLPRAAGLIDAGHYPHRCPKCGSAAYIGLNVIDCSGDCPRVGGI